MLMLLAQSSDILYYLEKMGPLFLFLALVLGIIGLPIPDEILMMTAGYLVACRKFNIGMTLLFGILGTICGITVSYLLGRFVGTWFIHKYGTALSITDEKVKKVKLWFSKIGKWLLIIGYFIPIIRHLFGFVAGGAKMNYPQFALFAYSGAILWTLTFIALGYYFHTFFAIGR